MNFSPTLSPNSSPSRQQQQCNDHHEALEFTTQLQLKEAALVRQVKDAQWDEMNYQTEVSQLRRAVHKLQLEKLESTAREEAQKKKAELALEFANSKIAELEKDLNDEQKAFSWLEKVNCDMTVRTVGLETEILSLTRLLQSSREEVTQCELEITKVKDEKTKSEKSLQLVQRSWQAATGQHSQERESFQVELEQQHSLRQKIEADFEHFRTVTLREQVSAAVGNCEACLSNQHREEMEDQDRHFQEQVHQMQEGFQQRLLEMRQHCAQKVAEMGKENDELQREYVELLNANLGRK